MWCVARTGNTSGLGTITVLLRTEPLTRQQRRRSLPLGYTNWRYFRTFRCRENSGLPFSDVNQRPTSEGTRRRW